MRTIRHSDLNDEVHANKLAGLATMIWGPPGQGKSETAYAGAKQDNAKLFEIRANLFDPVDVRGGMKVVEQEDGSYKTRYGIPEDYPPSDSLEPVWLLIDELPNAPKSTQNALLQLILDRRIGTYELPKNCCIVAAGNRAEDRAAVHEMPTPVKDRFAHYTLESNIDDWVAWALKNNIDESIIAFLRYRPGLLSDIDASQNAFPTPRAWAMLNKKLPFVKNMFYGCASLIGDGPAGEYIAFRNIYKDIPDLDKLVKNPTSTTVPTDPSVLFAICGGLATRVNDITFANIMKYVKRIPREFQIIIVKDALAKDTNLITSAPYTKWITDNADVLL